MYYHPLGPDWRKYRITDTYRWRHKHPLTGRSVMHWGRDYGTPQGTKLYATHDGTIRREPLGFGVRDDKTESRYKHSRLLSPALWGLLPGVEPGQKVQRGDYIGEVGPKDRYSTGAHLHFERGVRNKHGHYQTVAPFGSQFAYGTGMTPAQGMAAGRRMLAAKTGPIAMASIGGAFEGFGGAPATGETPSERAIRLKMEEEKRRRSMAAAQALGMGAGQKFGPRAQGPSQQEAQQAIARASFQGPKQDPYGVAQVRPELTQGDQRHRQAAAAAAMTDRRPMIGAQPAETAQAGPGSFLNKIDPEMWDRLIAMGGAMLANNRASYLPQGTAAIGAGLQAFAKGGQKKDQRAALRAAYAAALRPDGTLDQQKFSQALAAAGHPQYAIQKGLLQEKHSKIMQRKALGAGRGRKGTSLQKAYADINADVAEGRITPEEAEQRKTLLKRRYTGTRTKKSVEGFSVDKRARELMRTEGASPAKALEQARREKEEWDRVKAGKRDAF